MHHRRRKLSRLRSQHGSPGAVPEQDAGPPVLPVHHIGQAFGTDQQGSPAQACRDVRLCRIIREQKSGAGCVQVEAGRMDRSQLLLHFTGCTGKQHFRGKCTHDQQIDLFRLYISILQCPPCGLRRHGYRCLFLNDMPPCHSRPLPDPGIAGVYHLR